MLTGLLVVVPLATSVPVAAATQSADATSASDEATALKLASEFGHAVTVDSATTETELLQAQPDGTMQLSEDSEPVRVQQNGGWVPVNSTLTSVGGGLQPQAAAVPVKFSAGGSGPLVQVQGDSGQWLSETWAAGALPAPSVSASSATYADVYPGVDLKLTATPSGMADVLVIKDAAAAANPALAHVAFGIDDGSLTTAGTAGGTTLVKDVQGVTQLSATTATWWDSSADGASAAGPGGPGIASPVATAVTATSVSVDAASVATSPDVTYPVYVDPTWTAGRTGWGMVDSDDPTTAYWKDSTVIDGYQHVGYIDAAQSDDGHSHTTRSYWQMDTSPVVGKHILNATFATTEVWAFSCNPSPVQLWTTDPLTSSSTWNTKPAMKVLSDTQNVAYGYNSSCGQGQVHFDAGDAVQRTADATAPTLNLGMMAQSETDHNGWKKFLGAASLQINYVSFPTTPSNRTIAPCFAVCGLGAVINSRTPTFTAAAGDADPGVSLKYSFSVCAGTPSSVGSCHGPYADNEAAGGTASITMPTSAALTEGAWVWRVQACRIDYGTVCSDWTSWFNFSVDVTAPNKPSVTSADIDLVNGDNPKGEANVPATIYFGTDSANVWGYAFTSGTVAERLASTHCPRVSGNVGTVCATGTPKGSIVPTQMTNKLVAYAFDNAGNKSAPFTAYFTVVTPTAASSSHDWRADDSDYTNQPAQLADNNTSNPLSLALNGISWRTNGAHDQDASQDPAADTSMPTWLEASMYFNGTAAEAASDTSSSNPVTTLDSTHSLTIAAWVKPDAGSTGLRVIASQDTSGTRSALTLQRNNGYWQMCAPSATSGSPAVDCARTKYTYADDGTWVLVVGTWNSAANQLQVAAYNYDSGGNTATNMPGKPGMDNLADPTPHPTVATASQGALILGRDMNGDRWHGQIGGLDIFNGHVLSVSQQEALWSGLTVTFPNGSDS